MHQFRPRLDPLGERDTPNTLIGDGPVLITPIPAEFLVAPPAADPAATIGLTPFLFGGANGIVGMPGVQASGQICMTWTIVIAPFNPDLPAVTVPVTMNYFCPQWTGLQPGGRPELNAIAQGVVNQLVQAGVSAAVGEDGTTIVIHGPYGNGNHPQYGPVYGQVISIHQQIHVITNAQGTVIQNTADFTPTVTYRTFGDGTGS